MRRGAGAKRGEITVERDPLYPQGWLVTGEKAERWIRQTDFENEEAVGYLSDRLEKAGVEDALRAVGAEEGDTVTIGEISFAWEPRRGLIDDYDYGTGESADRERWQG